MKMKSPKHKFSEKMFHQIRLSRVNARMYTYQREPKQLGERLHLNLLLFDKSHTCSLVPGAIPPFEILSNESPQHTSATKVP